MESETTTETGASTETDAGEGESSDVVTLSKSDWEKHNQTLGSLKRELKDLKKAKEETKETSTTNPKPDEIALLKEKMEKQAIRHAGLTHQDDIELAKNTAKKWNMDVEDVLVDEDFLAKLGKQQTSRSNVEATSNVKGGAGKGGNARSTPEYWLAKGMAPTDAELATHNISRKEAAQIMRAFMENKGNTKKFYND